MNILKRLGLIENKTGTDDDPMGWEQVNDGLLLVWPDREHPGRYLGMRGQPLSDRDMALLTAHAKEIGAPGPLSLEGPGVATGPRPQESSAPSKIIFEGPGEVKVEDDEK